MAAAPLPRGFPDRFPVRSDGRRPLRYRVVAATSRLLARAIYRRQLRIEGLDDVPEGGPLLIACNHLSNLDPMLIGGFTPGTNFAMAKRELFANRLVAWMWAGCNVFPVDRGTADRWALRTALTVLEKGGRLILWVEGTRATSPGMKRAEAGVGFLLRRTRVPVMPAAVTGTEAALVKGKRLPRRVPLTLRFGPVFELPPDALRSRDNQAVADLVAQRIADLLPPAYRGVYGGRLPTP
jgi:1-acyl-sn-glycerol-3-phosphate acyltransferase